MKGAPLATKYYKSTDQILTVDQDFTPRPGTGEYGRIHTYIFDFEFRTLSVIENQKYGKASEEKLTLLPFSVVDEALLQKMHAKLINMGGKPEALPSPAAVKPQLPVPAAFRPEKKQ